MSGDELVHEMVKRARAYADSSPQNSREAFRSFINEMADALESLAARLAEADAVIFHTHQYVRPQDGHAQEAMERHAARAPRAGKGETR